jgi:hypothetical protein
MVMGWDGSLERARVRTKQCSVGLPVPVSGHLCLCFMKEATHLRIPSISSLLLLLRQSSFSLLGFLSFLFDHEDGGSKSVNLYQAER